MKKDGSGKDKVEGQRGSDSGKVRSESYKSKPQPHCVKVLDDPNGTSSSEEGDGNLASVREHMCVVKVEECFFFLELMEGKYHLRLILMGLFLFYPATGPSC